MTLIKHESGKMVMPKEQIDSPSTGDGSSGEPVAGGDGLKKGPWTSAEDMILVEYVQKHGDGNWNNVQKYSGLSRCGKSCRLRWANHLRPNLKKGTITPEEERKIIQLHSQMGNKWARMAVVLPGRTDNEIKNYWNTRAKRCERTGSPLHPPEVCFDTSNNNLRNQDVTNFGTLDKQYNEAMTGSTYGALPEIRFDYKFNPGLIPYSSYVPDTSSSMPTSYGFVDPTENHIKRLRENETSIRGFHGSLYSGLPICRQFSAWPYVNINQDFPLTSSFDPDSSIKNTSPFDIAVPGSLDQSNVNFPSSRPLPGTAELELPSFQNPETEISNWITCPSSPILEADSYIQSPIATTSASDPPRNSGLLEAVPQQGLSSTKNQQVQVQTRRRIPDFMPYEMLESSALNHIEANWGDNGDPVTPLCSNSASIFSETPPFSASSSDEFQSSQATSGSEHMLPTASFNGPASPDFSGPDGLIGPEWYDRSYGGEKDSYMLNDVIKELLAERNQFKQMPPGTTTSTPVQGSRPPFNQRSATL